MDEKYTVCFNNEEFQLDLVRTSSVSYYSFNMLGNSRLNHLVAEELWKRITAQGLHFDTILTVESKAIALTENLSQLLKIDRYIVVRKSQKSYMQNPVSFFGKTIISGTCNYVIDKPDIDWLCKKNVLILDDVVSTGGTIQTLLKILNCAKPQSTVIACALTEGNPHISFGDIPLISCGHIPLFNSKGEKMYD